MKLSGSLLSYDKGKGRMSVSITVAPFGNEWDVIEKVKSTETETDFILIHDKCCGEDRYYCRPWEDEPVNHLGYCFGGDYIHISPYVPSNKEYRDEFFPLHDFSETQEEYNVRSI